MEWNTPNTNTLCVLFVQCLVVAGVALVYAHSGLDMLAILKGFAP